MNRLNPLIRLLLLWTIATAAQALPGVTTTYYHSDALGNPAAATNEQGTVVWRKQFDPYGRELDTGGNAAKQNTTGYTGHRLDKDLNLVYAGARYYDPMLGRFTSLDPAGFTTGNPQSFNPYVYANNSPYRYVDLDGRDSTPFGMMLNQQRIREIQQNNPDFHQSATTMQSVAVAIITAVGVVELIPAAGPMILANEIATSDGPVVLRGARGVGARFADETKLLDHFSRHGADFGAKTATAYAKQADSFLTGPLGKGVLQRTRANGDIVRFNPATDEFGVLSSKGSIRTYYKPDPAVHGKSSNLDYFNEQ